MRKTARMTPKQARLLGWVRVDGGTDKCGAHWRHVSGQTLVHCGHPTALRPWILHTPVGADEHVSTNALGPRLGDAFGYAAAVRLEQQRGGNR
jgi:hypothetical protein